MTDFRSVGTRFPNVRGMKPTELPCAIRFDVPTDNTDGYGFADLRLWQNNGQFLSVQGIAFINDSTASYRVTQASTGFSVVIPAQTQGQIAFVANDDLQFDVQSTPAAAGPIRLWFLNSETETAFVSVNGTDPVTLSGPIPAGAAVIGSVSLSPNPAIGNTGIEPRIHDGVAGRAFLIKGSRGNVGRLSLWNTSAGNIWAKLFNKATLPVLGTDVARDSLLIPPGASINFNSGAYGAYFTLGIGLAFATGPQLDDAGNPAANVCGGTVQFT